MSTDRQMGRNSRFIQTQGPNPQIVYFDDTGSVEQSLLYFKIVQFTRFT